MGALSTIRDGLKTRLATITGLRAHDVIPGQVVTPAAVVGMPEQILFDLTFARGADRYTIPIRVYAAKADDRTSQDKIDGFLAGTGSGSIKAAIEGDVTLGATAHTCRVVEARGYGVYNVSGIDLLGVDFIVEVIA